MRVRLVAASECSACTRRVSPLEGDHPVVRDSPLGRIHHAGVQFLVENPVDLLRPVIEGLAHLAGLWPLRHTGKREPDSEQLPMPFVAEPDHKVAPVRRDLHGAIGHPPRLPVRPVEARANEGRRVIGRPEEVHG